MSILHLKCLKNIILPLKKELLSRRTFMHWLTIIFNKADMTRIQQFGPDRVCAEWCLKNGAAVQWVGAKTMLTDYNSLPREGTKFYIKKIDATGSSISHHGFLHLQGCNYINEFILDSCGYIENDALNQLKFIKKTLHYLKVANCGNITEEGLEYLINLTQLRKLELNHLDYVEEKKEILKVLETKLPNCQITHDFFPKQKSISNLTK